MTDADKDYRLLVKQTMEKMIEGCINIKEEKDLHQDVKDLAKLIIHDCKTLLMFTDLE
jgi:hypothetical protein